MTTESTPLRRLQTYTRQIVFGFEDSLVSTLGVVTGIAAGTGSGLIVILSGFVVIFVEALSMTAGEYLSSKSEKEVLRARLQERQDSIARDPEGEKKKLRALYKRQGFSPEEINAILPRITANPDIWLEEVGAHELHLGALQLTQPRQGAIYMGLSYLVIGIVPLFPYFFLPISSALFLSIAVTIITLFVIGVLKARFARVNWLRSGAEMVLVAMTAALIGFGVGRLVTYFFGIEVL